MHEHLPNPYWKTTQSKFASSNNKSADLVNMSKRKDAKFKFSASMIQGITILRFVFGIFYLKYAGMMEKQIT